MRRPAQITQSEVARIIRAAKQTGAVSVAVRIGEQASVVIRLDQSTDTENLAQTREIVL